MSCALGRYFESSVSFSYTPPLKDLKIKKLLYVKNKYCKEKVETKVDMCKCLLKINTIDNCRLMVTNRYNT